MAAIKIKLVVGRSRKRVLFADAGSDFIDVLLTFLMLPLSAVQLATSESSPGCLSNLCASVQHLGDNKLLKGEACHGMLLRPTHTEEFGCNRSVCSRCTPFLREHLTPQGQGHSQCSNCRCYEVMARLVHVYNQTARSEMFSKWKERFVISDEWVIKPASTSTVLFFLKGLSADEIKDSYEAEVDVGWTEVVSLLKTCVSTTIFTDVFLAKGTPRPALMNRSVLTIQKPRLQETNDPGPQIGIKLFFDRQDRKVMYAECKHNFVDLLLSFLTYPMGCVVKNLAGSSHRCGSFNNLYSSAAGLDAAGFLTGSCFGDKKTLLDPSLAPFKTQNNGSKQPIAAWYHFCWTPACSCAKNKRSCSFCEPGFVDDHTYVVDDKLLIHQASAVSLLKHWGTRNRYKVAEMDIVLSKQEAVALLGAVVDSKTALTDAFKGRLDQELQPLPPSNRSLEPMQIFVKNPAGETITLDVAMSDTIAAVRSKIQTKGKMRSYRLVYGGKCLQDPWTLADCGIHREATIHTEGLPLPPSNRSLEPMQIFVKNPAGETITLDVTMSDTIAAVRSKIQTKGKMRSYQLVYGGKCLQDPWTLADCGIHREATIHAEGLPPP